MPSAIQFGDSFGALFLANLVTGILSASLWGALCVQLYVYCLIYWKKDTWRLKTLIITVCLLDTAHQVFLSISIYEYLITHWGDSDYVTLINWHSLYRSIFPYPWCKGVSLLVHGPRHVGIKIRGHRHSFMVYRIYMFGKRIWLAIILETAVVAELGELSLFVDYLTRSSTCSAAWGGQLLKDATFVQLASVDNLSIACDAINAYNDIIIALVFAYIMQKQKSGFRRTTNMINKLVRLRLLPRDSESESELCADYPAYFHKIIYSLNTGLITAAFGVAALVSTAVRRDTLIFAFFFFTGGRLYANSLLAIVNLRNHTRRQGDDSQNFTSLSRFQAAHNLSVVISNDENAASGGPGIPLQNILSKDGSEGAIKGDMNTPMALDIKLDTEVTRIANFQSSQVCATSLTRTEKHANRRFGMLLASMPHPQAGRATACEITVTIRGLFAFRADGVSELAPLPRKLRFARLSASCTNQHRFMVL
ncbi:hypothetical protein EVG20_g10054, partial [Dentipellis fragilis]